MFWKLQSYKYLDEFQGFLLYLSLFSFNDSVHLSWYEIHRFVEAEVMFDQIHWSVIWTRSLMKWLRLEENLTFCTKQVTWSIMVSMTRAHILIGT